MGYPEKHEVELASAEVTRGAVYIPCPVCRKGVEIGGVARVRLKPSTYVCPACATSFVVVDNSP
jgi:predicted RNA-binding Zn-ribbon protein involved in translation (DUF1610 family)